MKVTDRKSLADYDKHCQTKLPRKIPDWQSRDFRRRVGDCIYDYSLGEEPRLRKGIHQKDNVETDLSGVNALLSDDFYYFGGRAIPLPAKLQTIIQKRGHKSKANDPYKHRFVRWIRSHSRAHNNVVADPDLKPEVLKWGGRAKCAKRDKEEAEADERRARRRKC